MASEQYSINQPFDHPAKTPLPVLQKVEQWLQANKIGRYDAAALQQATEAVLVNLGPAKAYLVKPATQEMCAENHCPMWLVQMKGKQAKLIWSSPAVSAVEILDKKLNKYRELKEVSAYPAHGSEQIWAWDARNYFEIYKNVWTWNAERTCRLTEETTQLMDGKMVQNNKQCLLN